MTLSIERLTPHTAGRYEDFLRALAGEPAVAAFRAGGPLMPPDSFYLFLASLDGLPAGAATAIVIPKLDARRGFLFVDELIVLPAFRRRGVARALLAWLEAETKTLGLAGLRLLARPENEAARALYYSAGFTESSSAFFEKRTVVNRAT
jgi:ribosomal protein S18 acetylase RimI-like enzyme